CADFPQAPKKKQSATRFTRLTSGPNGSQAGTASDPLAALRALPTLAEPQGTALLVLVNFHRFLGSPEVVQALTHQLMHGKQNRTFIVILSPVLQMPQPPSKPYIV
ncbi:MAG: hypothetical protein HC767_03515, partial [Akkermansiaceae bacterium]|nr:hypothetical protein [Akkermansiaceae bacterium]